MCGSLQKTDVVSTEGMHSVWLSAEDRRCVYRGYAQFVALCRRPTLCLQRVCTLCGSLQKTDVVSTEGMHSVWLSAEDQRCHEGV